VVRRVGRARSLIYLQHQKIPCFHAKHG
jgi:hypothetical protein